MILQAATYDLNWYTLGAFLAYFLVILGLGIYSSRYSGKGLSAYFLAGRSMSRFTVAVSAVVSGRSSWLVIGFTGIAYTQGVDALWYGVGYTVIEFFLFLYYAPKLRAYSERHNCITLPDYYAARFEDRNGLLRGLIVAIFLIFMVSYVSAQFVAGGKAFASSFGLTQDQGIYLSAGIILLYTILGGFMAVSLTDVFQGFFLVAGLIGLSVYGILEQGGLNEVSAQLSQMEGNYLSAFDLSTLSFLGAIGLGLGSPGNPHILIRYMSIKDPGQFRWTAVVGTIFNILMAGGALMVGLVGRVYFPEVSALPAEDAEKVYPELGQLLSHPIFFGLLLASIFSAIMSTADSQLLVAASSLVRDIYQRLWKQGAELPQQQLVLMSRAAVALLTVIAVYLSIQAQALVFWLVLFAWAGLGAALGSTSILALFWKKTTKAGVIAGLLVGTGTVIAWNNIPLLKDTIYELIPAFFLALAVTAGLSLLTRSGRVSA